MAQGVNEDYSAASVLHGVSPADGLLAEWERMASSLRAEVI